MATNFYIQFDGQSAVDIEAIYGIRVTSVRGLESGDPKSVFKREWANDDGIDVYVPESRKRESTTVTMTCLAEDSVGYKAKKKYDDFIAFIFNGTFVYYDTLQYRQVRLLLEGKKSSWYQFVGTNKVMFEVTFLNPSGNCTNIDPA